MAKANSLAILWFRNDLRLHDHEPLVASLKQFKGRVLPVFCFDPRQFSKTYFFQFPKCGPHRAKFLIESLEDLRSSLRKLGSDLFIRIGKPEEVIPDIVTNLQSTNNSVGAVFAHKEVPSEEVNVEKALQKSLSVSKVELKLLWGGMTMYHIEDLPFDIKGSKPLETYTAFRKRVEASTTKLRDPLPPPSKSDFQPIELKLESGDIPTVEQLMKLEGNESSLQGIDLSKALFKGGEIAALERVNDYLWKRKLIETYKESRNGLLGMDYSTKFAPWLANGCVSPRYIHQQVRKYEREVVANNSTYWVLFEKLLWRDYFKWIGVKHGNTIFQLYGLSKDYPGVKPSNKFWKKDTKLFNLWVEGKTGYPFVDANMLEIKHTGFMSNRGRQNVASFLIKDLGMDWRMGAEYFEGQLIDYDVCSNYGNWMYIAGVGNDPREDRYFNVVKQAHMYDAKAEYVTHWFPFLSKLPSPELKHRPFLLGNSEQAKYGINIGINYPRPLVDVKYFKK